MSTTIRVQPEDKEFLDRLQARFLLEKGERIALDAVLHRLIEACRTEGVDVFRPRVREPISDERWQQILEGRFTLGEETREGDIDGILYGDPHT